MLGTSPLHVNLFQNDIKSLAEVRCKMTCKID